MNDRLRVNYNMVENLINDMRGYGLDIERIYSEMTATVTGLVDKEYMEAESAEAYINEFTEMLAPDIEKLSDLISNYYLQLHEICINFAEADKQIAHSLC